MMTDEPYWNVIAPNWSFSSLCSSCKQPYGWPCSLIETFKDALKMISEIHPIINSRHSQHSLNDIFDDPGFDLNCCKRYTEKDKKMGRPPNDR